MAFEDVEHGGIIVSLIIGLLLLGRYLINGIRRTTHLYDTIEGDDKTGHVGLSAWQRRVEAALTGGVIAADGTTKPGILQQVEAIQATLKTHEDRFDRIQDELTLTSNGEQSLKNLVARTSRDLQSHLNEADTRQRITLEHMHSMREALIQQGFKLPPVTSEPPSVDEFASEVGLNGGRPATRRTDTHS